MAGPTASKAHFVLRSTNPGSTMTQKTMSAALFQAAQQIEGKSYSSDTDQGNESKDGHGMIPIAPAQTVSPNTVPIVQPASFTVKATKESNNRSRAIRLEQNRKAARESRRRKKAMVEELQRSLMFFSKSNAALKQQNEVFTRQILEAHSKLAEMGKPVPSLDPKLFEASFQPLHVEDVPCNTEEASSVIATYDSAFMASMQPGATMQAMASFQQAAHAAMEAASRTMKAHGVVVNPEESISHSTEV